uniref:BPTI/Kunitz inhibitor domain-containing protein n=1 Tax=Oncorhynchus tshawytscha TaxID=74940 RepID=A0A8C8HPH5_ONCTS
FETTCSLPKAAGSCSGWTGRYFYDVTASRCSHFWYGGCHGNNNNFLTIVECQRTQTYTHTRTHKHMLTGCMTVSSKSIGPFVVVLALYSSTLDLKRYNDYEAQIS